MILRLTMVAATVLILSSFLSSCGLIPPQTIDNPLQLEGQSVTITVGGDAAKGGLEPQADSVGDLNFRFDDLSLADLPVSPKQSLFSLALGTTLTLQTPTDFTPCGISITGFGMKVTVRDPSGELTLSTELLDKSVIFDQVKGSSTFTTDTVATTQALLAQADLNKLISLLTSGGTNEVTLTLDLKLQSVPDLPNGSRLTLTLGESSAVVGF